MMNQQAPIECDRNGSFSTRDVCAIFFRHKVVFIMHCLATLLTVGVGVILWPDTYQAKAALLVKLGRENLSDPTVGSSSHQVITSGVRKEDIHSEIRMLQSRDIIEQVVDALGPQVVSPPAHTPRTQWQRLLRQGQRTAKGCFQKAETFLVDMNLRKPLTPRQKTVLAIQKKLSVTQLRQSDVIELQLQWRSPETAKAILEQLMEFYLQRHLQAHKNAGGIQFFQAQLLASEERLDHTEQAIETIKQDFDISTYEEQKKQLLVKALDFEALLKECDANLAESHARVEELKQRKAALRASIPTGFRALLGELERQWVLQQVTVDALSQRRQALSRHIEAYRADLAHLNGCDLQLHQLMRQAKVQEENYALYHKKLEEVRIADAQDNQKMVNVRVIEPPLASFRPVQPRRLPMLMLALVLSPVLAFGIALCRDWVNHTIKTDQDVERYLDLPHLVSIKEAKPWNRLKRIPS